jgi:hypothetical protein
MTLIGNNGGGSHPAVAAKENQTMLRLITAATLLFAKQERLLMNKAAGG